MEPSDSTERVNRILRGTPDELKTDHLQTIQQIIQPSFAQYRIDPTQGGRAFIEPWLNYYSQSQDNPNIDSIYSIPLDGPETFAQNIELGELYTGVDVANADIEKRRRITQILIRVEQVGTSITENLTTEIGLAFRGFDSTVYFPEYYDQDTQSAGYEWVWSNFQTARPQVDDFNDTDLLWIGDQISEPGFYHMLQISPPQDPFRVVTEVTVFGIQANVTVDG